LFRPLLLLLLLLARGNAAAFSDTMLLLRLDRLLE
jgi:hypothetical protein